MDAFYQIKTDEAPRFGEPLFLCADAQPRLPCGQKSVTFGISALVLDSVGNDPIV